MTEGIDIGANFTTQASSPSEATLKLHANWKKQRQPKLKSWQAPYPFSSIGHPRKISNYQFATSACICANGERGTVLSEMIDGSSIRSLDRTRTEFRS